jgi:hypothetical protein
LGGAINLTAGGSGYGSGSDVNITAGRAGGVNWVAVRGGAVNLVGGPSDGPIQAGGLVTVTGGVGGTGPGGDVIVSGGSGADAGFVVLQPGLGNVGIGATSPGQKLEINGGLRLNPSSAKPDCNATTRGTVWFTQGAATVKDSVEVCAKDATDTYLWRLLY